MRRDPLSLLAPVARAGAIACGWLLLAVSVLTGVEIVGRKFFGFSVRGVDEISGYVLGIVSAVGFSYSLVRRAHMRVTLIFGYVPAGARTVLNLLAVVTLAAMALFCAWRGWVELAANIESLKPANTPLRTPLWIPQSLWFAGLALFACGSLAAAVHAGRLFFTDRARLDRLYGPPSIDDEVKEEIVHIERNDGAGRP